MGPSVYLSEEDSPFDKNSFSNGGYFHLENFEDGLFNTPGVSVNAGVVTSTSHPSLIDSVDGDDGQIDGSGSQGNSYFNGNKIVFTFNAATLGSLSTHVGIVWTDGSGMTSFEAFDNKNVSLGIVGPIAIADGSITGTTGEDRFLGAINLNGIKSIVISNGGAPLEVDHLQYGTHKINAKTNFIGPSVYLSEEDSPFDKNSFSSGGYFYLENFEDGLFNTPGVSADAGVVTSTSHPSLIDSVDGDDGQIDGSGSQGNSYFNDNKIIFTFDAATLGSLPTHVGIVWTDGSGMTSFEAFDDQNYSLGIVGPIAIDDGSITGTTGEDRFFGAINLNGIKSIVISNGSAPVEVDHLQYGRDQGKSKTNVFPVAIYDLLL